MEPLHLYQDQADCYTFITPLLEATDDEVRALQTQTLDALDSLYRANSELNDAKADLEHAQFRANLSPLEARMRARASRTTYPTESEATGNVKRARARCDYAGAFIACGTLGGYLYPAVTRSHDGTEMPLSPQELDILRQTSIDVATEFETKDGIGEIGKGLEHAWAANTARDANDEVGFEVNNKAAARFIGTGTDGSIELLLRKHGRDEMGNEHTRGARLLLGLGYAALDAPTILAIVEALDTQSVAAWQDTYAHRTPQDIDYGIAAEQDAYSQALANLHSTYADRLAELQQISPNLVADALKEVYGIDSLKATLGLDLLPDAWQRFLEAEQISAELAQQ
jgi:hypothetical protein